MRRSLGINSITSRTPRLVNLIRVPAVQAVKSCLDSITRKRARYYQFSRQYKRLPTNKQLND
jgi:hypothetical protein